MDKKIYLWNRFWSPRTGQINLGDGGFLWDPENEYGSMYNPDVKSFSAIETLPVLGLLGEPGIGKSFAMMNLVDGTKTKVASEGGQILYVDLRSVGSESRLEKKVFESPEFQVWNAEKIPLYIFLDSLDECLLSIQTASRLLADEFRRYPQQNLFIRIASRTWDWPIGLEISLKEHWGEESVGVFELAPLRRKDVVEAVIANELDPEKFIEEVQSREVVPLAIKPLTLEMLMNIFKHDGGLPSSKTEIYRRGCLLLADEPNQDRRDAHKFGTLSQQQRLITAGRIAALTVFAGKNAIWTGFDDGNIPNEDLILTDLIGGSESIDGNMFEINESALRETLSTGLFSSRGVHRMGWAHQTYAEFLAAIYLTSREVSQSQIASLLCHPSSSGGKLVPQLAEVTAWLASMNHALFSLIMEIDPEVILRGDMSIFDNDMKKALVLKLLWLYDEGGAADSDWALRSFYYKLDHPELANQLKTIIADEAKGVIVRRVAIDIAEACELRAIQSEILSVALNPIEVDHIRNQAACAIWRIGDETSKRALLPLAEGNAGNDPDDELKGYALKALWPDYISAESLFACLTPPKRDSFIGSYHFFLTDNITPSLTSDNINVALSWVETSLSGWRRIYVGKKLVKRIIAKATELLDAPSVAASFSKLVLKLLTDHNYEIIEALSKIKANDDVRNRQRITNAVLSMVESHQGKLESYYYSQMGFVRTEDVPWLIECCKNIPSNKAKIFLADIVQQLFVYEQSDMILNMCENEQVFADVFKGIREPILLDSPEADKMREYARRSKTERKKISPSPMLRIINSLDEIEAGAPDKWVDLLWDMAIDDYGYGSWPDSDMHKLPGWQNANLSVKARIVTAAKNYLLNGEPKIDSLFEDSTKFVAVASDYAIQLLLSEDEQFIQLLNNDIWKKWAKVVLAWSARRNDDELRNLLILAYNRAPEKIIEGINQIIEKDKKGSLISLWQVEHIWDEQIAATLFNKLNDPGLTPMAQAGLLKLLLEQRVAEAQHFAETLITMPLPEDGDGRMRAILAAEQLVSHAPDAGWLSVWPAIQKDSEFGHSVIAKLSESAIHNLSDEQIATLYIWLEQNKPHSEEKVDDDARRPTDFKDALIRYLKTRGTLGACLGIEKIIAAFPAIPWLKWTLHECQALYRRNTWQPPAPREVLALTEDRHTVLVRNGEELLEVVIASLKRLEQKLHGVTPMARFLWNGDRPKDENDFSDWVENHLKEDLKGRGIVANREVEFRRLSQSGVGEKTDIVVDAVSKNNSGFETITVVIESKGCWHNELKTAMDSQLMQRYLIDERHRYGLYLVGWFHCDQWNASDYRKKKNSDMTIDEAQAFFDKQAIGLSKGGRQIKALVVNTSLPK
jgi:hypothetical protein